MKPFFFKESQLITINSFMAMTIVLVWFTLAMLSYPSTCAKNVSICLGSTSQTQENGVFNSKSMGDIQIHVQWMEIFFNAVCFIVEIYFCLNGTSYFLSIWSLHTCDTFNHAVCLSCSHRNFPFPLLLTFLLPFPLFLLCSLLFFPLFLLLLLSSLFPPRLIIQGFLTLAIN